MTRSRLWLALVIVCFCLPLFIGLGDRDLGNDEAIYSFAVDRILEAGVWLVPKASPEDNLPFLEKPPLKFWIVAAPIEIGLLPHNEFGLRFWDAVFGSIAFVYVFLLGQRLFSPLTGAVAVMALFAHNSLLFDHGLRDNAMEGPLFLSYCGAVYHFLLWSAAASPEGSRRAPRGRGHAVATGLYFVLGFMVKYVAALFLPAVLVVSAFLLAPERQKLLRHWRLWTSIAVLAVILIVPWFAYSYALHGQRFWDGMFREHVVQRFTTSLDPGHLRPWYFYVERLWSMTISSGAGLVLVGLPLLVWQTIKRRWLEGTVLLVWLALPIVAISAGSSKLYHYAYPFLPPLALAAGYGAAMLFALAPAPFDRMMSAFYRRRAGGTAEAAGNLRNPVARAVLFAIVGLAIAIGVAALLFGGVRVPLPGGQVFRSTGTLRPALVAFVCAVPLGLYGRTRRTALLLLVAALLPLTGYRASLSELQSDRHPYRSLSQCVLRVQDAGAVTPGLYAAWPTPWMWHPVNYYFRRVRPWERVPHPDADRMERYASASAAADPRPVLISRAELATLPPDVQNRVVRPIDLDHDVLLLLPGPYAACQVDAGPLLAQR